MPLNLQQFILLTFPQVKARFGNLQGRNKFLLFILLVQNSFCLREGGFVFPIGWRFKEEKGEKEEKEKKTQNHSPHGMLHLLGKKGFSKFCTSLGFHSGRGNPAELRALQTSYAETLIIKDKVAPEIR